MRVTKLGAISPLWSGGFHAYSRPVKALKVHLRGKPKVYRSQFSGVWVKLPETLLSCVQATIVTRLRHTQLLPISNLDYPGRKGTAKASMGEWGMNCWTAKSSIPWVKPKSSLKDGGTITTPNDHTVHWVTAHRRQRPSCSWTKGQSCTNFQIGHSSGAAQVFKSICSKMR